MVSDRRVDVVGWSTLFDKEAPAPVAAAILLAKPMPFEFPRMLTDLIGELEARGVPRTSFLLTLQAAVLRNLKNTPLCVLIGTPMCGIRGSGQLRQHLSAWYISPEVSDALRLSISKYSDHERLRELRAEMEGIIWNWATAVAVSWCAVREDRPEIVIRRDHSSPMSWFCGRVVALWGCGALGSYVAEFLARAGVRKLILRDNSSVAPGVLVRQLFDDADVGQAKVEALAQRLRRIRDDLEIETHPENLLAEPLGEDDWSDGADLIIETTGARTVLKKTELRWSAGRRPGALASMVVGPRAERGFVVVARSTYSGGPSDVARRAKLVACDDDRLRDFLDEFWPSTDKQAIFQPEPGCSDPTFEGSAADVAVLAGSMLSHVARNLARERPADAAAHFLTRPDLEVAADVARVADLAWPAEHAVRDQQRGYDVRISDSAWRAMLACIERSRRRRGPHVETGGLLFGERDDAARVIWITDASDPPPDSRATRNGFLCGTRGVAEMNREKTSRTRGSAYSIGTWHTHPDGPPVPSPTDLSGMAQIVTSVSPPIRHALLVIVGYTPHHPTLSAFLFNCDDVINVPTPDRLDTQAWLVSQFVDLLYQLAGLARVHRWPKLTRNKK